jgi:pimeloyl-[acyl-carrier protein] methyl ester esterase
VTALHSRVFGTGPALVLLHGWGMHSGLLAPLAQRLAVRRSAILIDLPGYGTSAWKRRPGALGALDTLALSVERAVPDNAVVLGWSLGGLVALELARRELCRIDALILVGTTPRFVAGDGWPCAIPSDEFGALRARLAADPVVCLDEFAVLAARSDARARAVLRELRRYRHAPHAQALDAGLDILEHSDLRTALPRIAVPSLVVSGDRDRIAPPAAARFLAANLQNAELQVISGAGHAPFVGREALLADAVERFLARRAAFAPA